MPLCGVVVFRIRFCLDSRSGQSRVLFFCVCRVFYVPLVLLQNFWRLPPPCFFLVDRPLSRSCALSSMLLSHGICCHVLCILRKYLFAAGVGGLFLRIDHFVWPSLLRPNATQIPPPPGPHKPLVGSSVANCMLWSNICKW